MDRVLFAALSFLLVLLVLSLLDMTICSYACVFGYAASQRFRDSRRNLLISVLIYFISNVLVYFTGIVLLLKGELKMTSDKLVITIASKMHMASMAFIVAALITILITIYSATARKGNIGDLKELITRCICYAAFFWILSWLII